MIEIISPLVDQHQECYIKTANNKIKKVTFIKLVLRTIERSVENCNCQTC
jgi:hypothetical protein